MKFNKFTLVPKWVRDWRTKTLSQLAIISGNQDQILSQIQYRRKASEAEVVDLVIVAGDMRGTREVERAFELFLHSNARIVYRPEHVMGMEIKHFIVMKGAEQNCNFPVLIDAVRSRVR